MRTEAIFVVTMKYKITAAAMNLVKCFIILCVFRSKALLLWFWVPAATLSPPDKFTKRLHGVVSCNSCPLLYEKKLSHLTLLPSCLSPPLEANSSFLCERLVEFFKQISKESV